MHISHTHTHTRTHTSTYIRMYCSRMTRLAEWTNLTAVNTATSKKNEARKSVFEKKEWMWRVLRDERVWRRKSKQEEDGLFFRPTSWLFLWWWQHRGRHTVVQSTQQGHLHSDVSSRTLKHPHDTLTLTLTPRWRSRLWKGGRDRGRQTKERPNTANEEDLSWQPWRSWRQG